MDRANPSGIKLTADDAALIKGMLNRGDRQHDIAAWFGVNGGRIAEISKRLKFGEVLMKVDGLPPPGPYLSGKQTQRARSALEDIVEDLKINLSRSKSTITQAKIQKLVHQLESVLSGF